MSGGGGASAAATAHLDDEPRNRKWLPGGGVKQALPECVVRTSYSSDRCCSVRSPVGDDVTASASASVLLNGHALLECSTSVFVRCANQQ